MYFHPLYTWIGILVVVFLLALVKVTPFAEECIAPVPGGPT